MKMKPLIWAALATAAAFAAFPPAIAQPADPAPIAAKGVLHADEAGPKVHRQIFGQFAEHLGDGIYEGVWVGEGSDIPNTNGYRNDVIEALRDLSVPLVRWPGGCFADEYRWREGIGPREDRPVKVNTHWGGVTEPNSFGTHEFMNFAELLGAETYVSGNVGSAPPSELAEWVEYMTSPTTSTLAEERRANGRDEPWKLDYVGIGNELWGCGGQMKADYAADVTRRYATFIKAPAGVDILKIASGASDFNYNWTETMMREAGDVVDGIGVHYYTVTHDWTNKGSATDFSEEEWAKNLSKAFRMDELLTKHIAIMDKYDPDGRVWLAVDEWGAWHDPEPGTNPGFLRQQNSLRDGALAAMTLNIFVKHAERVKMANIAQMVNVLQAMILTDGDKMVLTPTYHVYHMYKPWLDAARLPIEVKSPVYSVGDWKMPAVSVSAVKDAEGDIHVALVNLDPKRPAQATVKLSGVGAATVAGQVLTAAEMTAHNTFDKPNAVAPAPFSGARIEAGALVADLPAKSVVVLRLQ